MLAATGIAATGMAATGMADTAVGTFVAFEDPELLRGALVGRYVVLARLGAGGMGVVYTAYDPELDRKVALKLLHPRLDADPRVTGEARGRLVREAQALARLNHPHIVAIHDVGEHERAVWLAMEYVDGETLAAWLAQRRRTWREVLDVLTPAARGLAAAHEAGLVHRDVKPDNLMLGRDGRVRVMDLGLSRAEGDSSERVDTAPYHVSRASTATQVGAVMGTPAYMSPEQFRGAPVDARTDVFSLCVTLWEALMGERPFAGATLFELEACVLAGKLRPVPRDPYARRVPGWLRRVCLRGLAVAPERRFASMTALVDALSHGLARARVKQWLVGAAAVAALGAAGLAARQVDRAARVAACEAAGASISAVWSDEARARIHAGIVATGLGYAPTTADKLMPFLDAQAAAWREHRTGACRMADLEGTLDAEQFDRAVWCLDERRMELAALVDELAHADATIVQGAVTAAAGLPPVSPCTDLKVLAALPAPPPVASRAKADAVRTQLSRARALHSAGNYPDAAKPAQMALADAEALGWPPMIAAAREFEGLLLSDTGAYPQAEAASLAAYMTAAKAQAWDVAAAAASALVINIGAHQVRPAEAKVWAGHAEVALQFAGDPLGLNEAVRLRNLAEVHRVAGEHRESKLLAERALAIQEQALGQGHPHVAGYLASLANTHLVMGDLAEAKQLYERTLAVEEEALGEGHPDVAITLTNLATVHRSMGSYSAVKALAGRALAIQEEVLGPDHPELAVALNNLAHVHMTTGSYAEARALAERALAIRERAYGPEHPNVAVSINTLGTIHRSIGSYAEAKALSERALASLEKVHGREHPAVAAALNNLVRVHLGIGAYAEAKALAERLLAMSEKLLGPDHANLATAISNLALAHQGLGAYTEAKALHERALAIFEKAPGPIQAAPSLASLGDIALARGQLDQAGPLLERAVALYEAYEGVQELESAARFSLARVLISSPDERARALTEARKAADGFRAAGEGKREQLEEVEAFLAEHAAAP